MSLQSHYAQVFLLYLFAITGLVYDYFSRLSGITEYGTRLPLDVKSEAGNE